MSALIMTKNFINLGTMGQLSHGRQYEMLQAWTSGAAGAQMPAGTGGSAGAAPRTGERSHQQHDHCA